MMATPLAKPRVRVAAVVEKINRDMSAHAGADLSDRTMASWNPPAGSADADLIGELDVLVPRSRDLARNNGIASGAMQTYRDNIVGNILRLSSKPDYRLLDKTHEWAHEWGNSTEAHFRSWADTAECDAGRTLDLLGLSQQALGAAMLNGEALAIPLWLPRTDSKWSTRLMMVEADRLATPPGMEHRKDMRGGIEVDKYGAPVAYWIQKEHPGDAYAGYGRFVGSPDQWERIPAFTAWGRRRVIHLHDKERTGQSRGKPIVSAVMREFKMAGHYATTELQAAVANSLIAAFLESDLDAESAANLFGSEPGKAWNEQMKEFRASLKGRGMSSLDQLAEACGNVNYQSQAASMRYAHLAARLYNTPLLIHPDKAAVIESILRGYMNGESRVVVDAAQYQSESAARKPYRVTTGGVAVVPVMGTLVNRGSWMDAMSGITSYERIAAHLDAALSDQDVRAVLLAVDSPGGEANGVFDLSNKLMAARAQKPIWAMADGDAFSAAYAIASSAEKFYTTRTAMAGSIGVIAMHLDQSVRLDKAGVKYTAIIAGDKKADFASHQPLSDRARASMQSLVDDMYGLFVASVATARNLSEQAVRDTQAGVYTAPEAQRIGLIDGIGTFDDIVARLEQQASQQSINLRASARAQPTRREPMSEKTNGAGADQSPVITQAEVDRARSEGTAVGAKQERERIRSILTHAEATGREAQARTLALETELNAEQAGKVLAVSPKQSEAAAQGGAFAAAMAAQGNPNVAPSGDGGGDKEADAKAEAARCVELFQGGRRK